MYDFINDPRFKGIEPFKNKLWLSSPTMHGDEQHTIFAAFMMERTMKNCGRKYTITLRRHMISARLGHWGQVPLNFYKRNNSY